MRTALGADLSGGVLQMRLCCSEKAALCGSASFCCSDFAAKHRAAT
jgi:hypothetical protein